MQQRSEHRSHLVFKMCQSQHFLPLHYLVSDICVDIVHFKMYQLDFELIQTDMVHRTCDRS